MSQQFYEQCQRAEEWEEDCLPPHKRSGYAESIAEQADFLRKQKREEDLIKGNENGN